jgi:flagellar motor switch protein FliG
MNNKTIVLTMYGTRKAVSDFTITLFDKTIYDGDTTAEDYCSIINELELKDDNWVYASIVKENQRIKFAKPGHTDFDILGALDNRAIQKVIREIGDLQVFGKALKSAGKEITCAVLRNVSKRAAKIIVEDMEYMGPVRLIDVTEARKQIVEAIRHLEKTGEITVPNSSQDEKN